MVSMYAERIRVEFEAMERSGTFDGWVGRASLEKNSHFNLGSSGFSRGPEAREWFSLVLRSLYHLALTQPHASRFTD